MEESNTNTTDPTQPMEETSVAIASDADDGEVATTSSAKNQDTSVEQADNKDKDKVHVDGEDEDVDGEDDGIDGGGKSLLVVHAYIFSCCN